ncbi:hypothetical protein HRbin23_00686 [bacterium HR23]|nr:hypothetical protein HRbin23_00686 [bacterium HR23]
MLLKDTDELLPHHPSFLLRVYYPPQALQEALGGVHISDLQAQACAEGIQYPLRLLTTEETVIDKDAGELVAHRPMDKDGGNRRVHTPRQRADHPSVAHLGTNLLRGIGDEVSRRPQPLAPAYLVKEVGNNLASIRGVGHLWVELEAVKAPFR